MTARIRGPSLVRVAITRLQAQRLNYRTVGTRRLEAAGQIVKALPNLGARMAEDRGDDMDIVRRPDRNRSAGAASEEVGANGSAIAGSGLGHPNADWLILQRGPVGRNP